MTTIYTLEHPITNEVRYVGKTVRSLSIRLSQHKCVREKSYKANWITSLLKDGLVPVIKILEEVEDEASSSSEVYWISQFKAWGFRLTNLTEGGEGTVGLRYTQEEKDLISAKAKGRKFTEEHKAKIASSLKGKSKTNEHRQKLREANLGKKLSEETKRKLLAVVRTSKPVYQYLEGILVNSYISANEAASINNTKPANIRQVCLNKSKSSIGYWWSYNKI